MTWIMCVLVSITCLATHILAVRALGDKLPAAFVTPAFYTVALFVLYVVAVIEKPRVDWQAITQPNLLLPLILAGITIGLTDLFFVKSLGLGATAAVAMPILLAGSTVLVAVLSVLIFKDHLTMQKIVGIALALGGLVLIYRG